MRQREQVQALLPKLIDPLGGGRRHDPAGIADRRHAGHVFAERGFELLEIGDTLVACIVHNTSIPTVWGLGARFDDEHERRWRARIDELPRNRAQAALTLLQCHPDDAAEPLRDGQDLHGVTWRIDDDDEILSRSPASSSANMS